jgi:hypothetical protein
MERALQALMAAVLLATALAMIWHEQSRRAAKRPLLANSEHLLEAYWMAYCSLIVLGITVALSAMIGT